MAWTPKRLALLLIDLLVFGVCWILVYNLRFAETGIPQSSSVASDDYLLQMKLLLLPVVLTHGAILLALQFYRGMWRYSGTTELKALLIGAGVWLLGWGLFNLYIEQQEQFLELPQRRVGDGFEVIRVPWGVLVPYILMSTMVVGALRFLPRLMQEASTRSDASDAPATLIVGAGDLADGVLRSILRGGGDFRPVCAVAQSPARVGLRLHGIPVVGTIDKIPEVIRENKIQRVLIAVENQSPAELRRVVSACESAEVTFRIVPSLSDVDSGRVAVSKVREVEIEDLLGREPVEQELAADRNFIRGEVVLITGAGGSIGSELARQCAASGAAKLLLLGKGENSIFAIAAELARRFPAVPVESIIADVRDADRMEAVFQSHRPSIVLHAAAHKHVPLMESAPDEAVKNNVLGTANVAMLSERHGVQRFVLISTDKAVRPTSIMGATKRYAESIVFSLARESRCCFQAVRFGNVLGSRGSVIPTFREQIAAGGPVTITHPDVTRYFMTIPEAVSLVLQAGSRGRNGALYLLDMGDPIRIADLARNMISLSGLRPESDIAIRYIGLRPGEKLHEELLTKAEGVQATELNKIFCTTPDQVRPFDAIRQDLAKLSELADRGDAAAIRAHLQAAIPDFHPAGDGLPTAEQLREEIASMGRAAAPPPITLHDLRPPEPARTEPVTSSLVMEQTDLLEMPPADETVIPDPLPTSDDLLRETQILPALNEAPAPSDSVQPEEPIADEFPPDDSSSIEATSAEEWASEPGNQPPTSPTAERSAESLPRAEPPDEKPPALPAFVEGSLDDERGMEAAAETVRLAPLDETLKPLLPEPEESDPLVDSNPNPLDSMPRQPAVDLSSQPISTFLASASPEPHAPALEPDFPEALESDLFAETPAETGERSQGPEGDQAAPEPKEEEVSLTMSNSNFVIALRVTKGIDAATLGQLVQVLQGFVGAEDRVVAVGAAADLAGLPAGTLQVATDGKAEGAAFAEAVSLHPGAGILLTTTTEVIFDANALALFAEALRGSAPLAYADYREDRDGAVSDVRLHDHEGCPHERFEFGPVIAYDLNAVEAVGGIRTDLNFAWEYDLHLKLMEQAEFAHIKQIAYTRFVPVVVDEKGKKVFSPGMGPLGGFSYVFYPEAVEREVTSVFEEALHRRGAWIDHPPAVVDHSGRTYETLASIVIPILNRVKYIANAIEKVQKGTFPNFEMIIVDNGSTDGTIDVVKNIAAQDPRIRLLHGKGGSIASALNEGIKAARGKYICQLDSDDEYAPDCLELMIGHLESHPTCGLAISYYRLMDENGVIIEDVAPITHSGYSRNQILRRDGAGAVRIFPKVVLEEFGYYDEVHYGNFGEDYDMVLKTGEKYSVDRVHKVLYHYRRHADNTDVTRDPEMKYKNKNRARQEALRRRKEINLALASA